MKITDIKLRIVEVPQQPNVFYAPVSGTRTPKAVPVPPGRRPLFSYEFVPSDRPYRIPFIHVQTDEGVEGFCSAGYNSAGAPVVLKMLKSLLVGEDPLDRERLWQKLRGARRLLHVSRSWAGAVDNCLWDLAGKVAELPVYKLMGAVRDRIPCYWSAMEIPAEQNLRDALQAKEMGYYGYKFHSYKGPRDDIANFEEVREGVGDDFHLMQDAAATYTLSEALKVGRVLERLGFFWFEEPVPDTDLAELQTLVRELDIPILATEGFCGEMIPLVAQYLRAGATDLLRGSTTSGITTVLKLAHFAEMYNTSIELVSESDRGLYGLVGTHVSCAISNTTYLEDWRDRNRLGKEFGILNAPKAIDGCMVPPEGPGFGAEIDWDWMQKHTVAEL